jgi:hypothetical protein
MFDNLQESIIRRLSILTAAICVGVGLAIAGTQVSAEEFQFPVRSIDEVAEGAMPSISNLTATDATIKFQSSIDLACSVVFGQTHDFGGIAIDDDMDGGAHSDHHPVLAGLIPETEYFFRVQGTSSDGTIYVGQVRSFRTPPPNTGGPVNLATLEAGASVRTVSSNYGAAKNQEAWGANSAIDGNQKSAWSSAGDGDEAFFEVELAEIYNVGEISVWTRSMSDGTARILSFTITTDSGTTLGPFNLPDASSAYSFPINETTRSLRLEVIESTGGNVGLFELGVFAN